MAEMLLINPRRRRRAAKASSARRTPAKRRVTARRRRRNPISAQGVIARAVRRIPAKRRANPHRRHARGRRRNPIRVGMGNKVTIKSVMSMFQEAAIGGAGSIAVDVMYAKVNSMLPASMQVSPTGVGIGDALKAAFTAVVGQGLSRMTKGYSKKMAVGSLTVQARDILSTFLPDSVALAGLGYSTPGRVVAMNNRVGPNRLAAYSQPGRTALLSGVSAYAKPGGSSPLLSAVGSRPRMSTAQREGFNIR